ncbi:helix-turn-helix transcriptional regulator [Arsenicicoccus piscis]|uniref:HTH deoR-type domain-containing protein n=1 Tax=Arsenicicoccus piscis TaxID=673954 RepID=A0ABQ6HR30_9MICO|nr:YafY family protein [Arsenicicoccus piscis]GMA20817.1 hypothetical protein GCM10025862_28380 [Arsenicicoccus piscis]
MAETIRRILRLLDLLQSRPVWSGPELAGRLGVTDRTIRRDVERLRELGYLVEGEHGSAGGYRLRAGRELPPLLLDDEEAIAIAVSLRGAATSPVSGVGEAALRALAKLDTVFPPRLRAQVAAVQEVTTAVPRAVTEVGPEVLVEVARAARGRVQLRFDYTTRAGAVSGRRVEPYRIVTTGLRWYLMAFDLEREDWRTFRLDRIASVHVTTFRFTPALRPTPPSSCSRPSPGRATGTRSRWPSALRSTTSGPASRPTSGRWSPLPRRLSVMGAARQRWCASVATTSTAWPGTWPGSRCRSTRR